MIGDMLGWLNAHKDDTLLAVMATALVTGVAGFIGYVGKLIVDAIMAWREERRLYRSAVIRFHNDVLIWQKDFRQAYTSETFDQMADLVIAGGDKFKFAMPASDQSDYTEMMKFIHRMTVSQTRVIRTFIVYSGLLQSIGEMLGSDLEKFQKPRKLKALAVFRETAEFVLTLSDEVIMSLDREDYLADGREQFEALMDGQKVIRNRSQAFLDKHRGKLPPEPEKAGRAQSSGGSGPDMIDLQELNKLVHKITTAYRKFNSSD